MLGSSFISIKLINVEPILGPRIILPVQNVQNAPSGTLKGLEQELSQLRRKPSK